VALKRADADKAKAVIDTLFTKGIGMKHIVVVDDDIDVFSDEEVEWAMATRFRSDRDLVLGNDFRGFYEDPTADAQGRIAKIGFDLTAPPQAAARIKGRRPRPPVVNGSPAFKSIRDALAAGPKNFGQIMAAVGSRDGRELTLELDALRRQGGLTRLDDGQYVLKVGQK
jgi:2,5-furandicarboxylate decarboxylase 1